MTKGKEKFDLIEKRKSIRVDVNNICELKITGTTDFEYCFLKDISVLGLGFFSGEHYEKGEVADFTIVLDTKIIELEVEIVATYYKIEQQSRYGAQITFIDADSKKILENYITEQVRDSWNKKMTNFLK